MPDILHGGRPSPNLPHVIFTTPIGPIEAAIDGRRAPMTATHFLTLVDRGAYRTGSFYRAIDPATDPSPVFVSAVQGGLYRTGGMTADRGISHESTAATGLRHVAGTLSMARLAVGSAWSEFFIVLDDSPALDTGGARQPDGHGFAAFGRIVAGLDIARAIQHLEQLPEALLPGELIHPVPFAAVRRAGA